MSKKIGIDKKDYFNVVAYWDKAEKHYMANLMTFPATATDEQIKALYDTQLRDWLKKHDIAEDKAKNIEVQIIGSINLVNGHMLGCRGQRAD